MCEFGPTVRGCIMVARSIQNRNASTSAKDPLFRQMCLDILVSESSRVGSQAQTGRVKEVLNELIDCYC